MLINASKKAFSLVKLCNDYVISLTCLIVFRPNKVTFSSESYQTMVYLPHELTIVGNLKWPDMG